MTATIYSPAETYHRTLVVTGDAVMADKARQSIWRQRDAERDALLTWNEAARAFVAELADVRCHNCGAVGPAAVCPRCQQPTCKRCMIDGYGTCAPCAIDVQRESFAQALR